MTPAPACPAPQDDRPLKLRGARWRHYSAPVPSGCRWCGAPQETGHSLGKWCGTPTRRSYEPPTVAQHRARMWARRAERLAGIPIHTRTPGLIVTWSASGRCYEIRQHTTRLLLASGWIRPRDAVHTANALREHADWLLPAHDLNEAPYRAVARIAELIHAAGGRFRTLAPRPAAAPPGAAAPAGTDTTDTHPGDTPR